MEEGIVVPKLQQRGFALQQLMPRQQGQQRAFAVRELGAELPATSKPRTTSAGSPAPADQPPTTARHFPVGKKVPFLVYTLPYEQAGWLLWCTLAQSKIPVAGWYKHFQIAHFVVYNLLID